MITISLAAAGMNRDPKQVTLQGFYPHQTVTLEDTARATLTSAWSPFVFQSPRRIAENFASTELLTLDFDDGQTISEVENQLSGWAYAILTTKSHQKLKAGKTCDRFRLLIPLHTRITSIEVYRTLWDAFVSMHHLAVDKACRDVARYYWASIDLIAVQDGNTIPVPEHAPPALAREGRLVVHTPTTPIGSAQIQHFLMGKGIVKSNRNVMLNNTAFSVFGYYKCDFDTGLVYLANFNQKQLDPPLDEFEFMQTVNSAWKSREKMVNKPAEESRQNIQNSNRSQSAYEWTPQNDVATVVPLLDASGLYLYRDLTGGTKLLAQTKAGGDEVTLIIDELAVGMLDQAMRKSSQPELSIKRLRESLAKWKAVTQRTVSIMPPPIKFADQPGLCFKRFDWVPTEGKHPAWDEFLDRLGEGRDIFLAWVWSCFEMENKSRQFIWLVGDGQDGKSTILSVLSDCFGAASSALTGALVGSDSRRFATAEMVGKRFITWGDCRSLNVAMSEMIRNITSGDPIQVEPKHQSAYKTVLQVKLAIASNHEPAVTSGAADMSRLILLRVLSNTSLERRDDPSWPRRLVGELPALLWGARRLYGALCPRGGDIQLNEHVARANREAAGEHEMEFEEVFKLAFVKEMGAVTVASDLLQLFESLKWNNGKIGDFKAWMKRTHGIEYKRTSVHRLYIDVSYTRWIKQRAF